jgi:AcrR family transcriptional regulator
MTTSEAPKPLRKDAARNRELVLTAAEAIFSESGHRGHVDEVARRAGVGVGTVCRHFPTKQALVDAVLVRMYQSLVEDAHRALELDDPADAFEAFFLSLAEFQVRHRALAEQMAAELELPETSDELRDQLNASVSTLVQRAQAAGAIRADIGPADAAMLFAGAAHAASLIGDVEPALLDRYLRIILDGLRPARPSALPGRALDFRALRKLQRKRG